MGPNKQRKKIAEGDMRYGDDIAIRVMEAVADEHVTQQLQKVLYPQPLMYKFTEINTPIDGLTKQLTSKESSDRTEHYSRLSNLLFSRFKETENHASIEPNQ